MLLRPYMCALFALLCATLTARADTPPNVGLQRVYLGDGRTLTVSAPKRLTTDAHIWQFMARPNTQDVMYADMTKRGVDVTQYLRSVNFKTGRNTTLREAHPAWDSAETDAGYELDGWSSDGRFLMAMRRELVPTSIPNSFTLDCAYDIVDTAFSPPDVRRIILPDWTKAHIDMGGTVTWSPSGKKVALAFYVPPAAPAPFGINTPNAVDTPMPSVVIYDLLTDETRSITRRCGWEVLGWVDENGLLMAQDAGEDLGLVRLDLRTGRETPSRDTRPLPPQAPRPFHGLLVGPDTILNAAARDKPSTSPEKCSLWLFIYRARHKMIRVCLRSQIGPDLSQEVAAPDGSAALWLEHGDLYASTFAVVPATDADKAAAPAQSR